jgi:putative copper export protein
MEWGPDTLAETVRLLGAVVMMTAVGLVLLDERTLSPLRVALFGALVLALGSIGLLIATVAPVAARREESVLALAFEYFVATGHGRQLMIPLLPAAYALVLFQTLRTADTPFARRGICVLLAIVLAAIPVFMGTSGHTPGVAGSERMERFGMIAQALHVTCGLAWVALVASFLPRVLRGEPLAPALRPIGNVALGLVIVLAASGVVTAWLHGVRLAWLVGEAYGQLLVLKTAALGAALAAAAWNRFVELRRRVVRESRLGNVLVAEALALVLALGLAAWLARTLPPE